MAELKARLPCPGESRSEGEKSETNKRINCDENTNILLTKDNQSELKRILPEKRGSHYQSQQIQQAAFVPPPGAVSTMGTAEWVDGALL